MSNHAATPEEETPVGKYLMGLALVVALLFIIFSYKSSEKGGNGEEVLTRGYMEDGLYIQPKSSRILPRVNTSTGIKVTPNSQGSRITVTTNCRSEIMAFKLKLGEKTQIYHQLFGDKALDYERPSPNHCSYDAAGNYKTYKDLKVKKIGTQTSRPRYQEDLWFPDTPPHVIVFFIRNPKTGEIIWHDYLKNRGDLLNFINTLPHEVEVWMVYNYIRAIMESSAKEQIGHDGSTATYIFATKKIKKGE